MHFTGWKLGLKTGMYYLRTMAASAPIQFTVDQEKLKVVDTNVARASGTKKRSIQGGFAMSTPSAVPRPMYESKTPNNSTAPNGVPTPSSTPPPQSEIKRASTTPNKLPQAVPAFPADADEGESPRVLAIDGVNGTPVEDELPEPAVSGVSKQEEDKEDASQDREGDIYAEAVLACSIENPESCVMCSG
ncbi:hypothetical protein LTR28_003910 [Elasticomyces elasticus]|nr:hypothetical protein LTR28_003910 [Elasticomyces elasticus]